MIACPECGAVTKRRHNATTGLCGDAHGCKVRRCHRRQLQDARRSETRQCPATKGKRSILCCELHVNHKGKHLNGTQEWEGKESHPLVQTIMALQTRRENWMKK